MQIPTLDQALISKAIEATEQLLEAYIEDEQKFDVELEKLGVELGSAQSVLSLLERNDERRIKLRSCGHLSSIYSDFISGQDPAIAINDANYLIRMIEGKISSFKLLKDETANAISLLNKDLKDLKNLTNKRFNNIHYYFAAPTHGWSLSYLGKLNRNFALFNRHKFI